MAPKLGWTGHVLHHNDLIVHDVLFSRADYRGRGRHRTLVADLAGDVSLVCNFASEDSSLPLKRDEFNSSSSSFIRQAGRDLGCFKCPSCTKPYISASCYQKHLSKCPQPTGAEVKSQSTLKRFSRFGYTAQLISFNDIIKSCSVA